MPGGGVEKTSTKYWLLHDDNNRILLATLTAFALAAGSTVLWRTRRTSEPAAHSQQGQGQKEQEIEMSVQEAAIIPGGSTMAGTSKPPKNSRSKERRRRNKEPKEPVTKHHVLQTPAPVASGNWKKDKPKNKAPSKTMAGGSIMVVPEIIEPNATSHDESRSQSTASPSTSRSSSLSMPSTGSKDPALLDVVDPALELEGDEETTFTTNITTSTSTPVTHELTLVVPTSRSDTTHLSTTSNSSSSSSSGEQSQAYPPTPPSTNAYNVLYQPDPNSSSSLQPSVSMYPHYTTRSPSRSPNRQMSPSPNGSWDYDQIPSLGPDSTITNNINSNAGMSGGGGGYRKPPRFRSKSRGASGPPGTNSFDINPISNSMQSSASYTLLPGYTTGPGDNSGSGGPLLVPSSGYNIESGIDDLAMGGVSKDKDSDEVEVLPTFTFPTLNPSPSPSPSPGPSSISRPASSSSSRPKISTAASHHYHRSNTPSSSSHASSPLRTPTPSQSPMSASYATSGSAVSAQTQLASLRGALEAARLREEKARQDADRLGRECADLKWRWGEEAGRWRAREGEVSYLAGIDFSSYN